ncbi:chemotaxis protein CheB [Mycobacterium branderi]|uniref:protein-glutamate methylesterase n=1 Tax=Mycobacterium branderi TaxID=43348 RepID=A0ABM7KP67_9MYCO|nr:chemotaxis protein CheB [Mycobacterium branderi]MCV7231126.1 chemotaxis protein CheB [Mycobacterium branderi]BBZ12745.1 hypothetical protein MBRA_29400 [Mycobacterium branderi]
MARTGTASEGVVAVGASAGGIEALTELVASLPPDFPFAVMVAIHMWAGGPSVLAEILDRSGPLAATAATDGAILEPGRIYVAVPDNHLLARDHRVMLSDGPSESGRRPAIDVLFRSVALDYGSRAIGVLMSGLLDDGVAGLGAIKAAGGTAVVQDPMDALFPDLPRNALESGVADYALAAKDIGGLLGQLGDRGVQDEEMGPDGRSAVSVDPEQVGLRCAS